ncbi:DUF2325 domain-containing protein [Brevibacillus sp. SYP-B805]|uniref:DUF2325 domain-containing protein n=1 Tax=Brevibacillus sp. SYP-B805 TaxID=1578199 RepID=UPI0013ECBBC7|nr:DUF2325 domain-containing protein [Brevibacillus sp. SYP-B805]NGQ96746.1 DUF2325 domain-containing protein [Brevibacillus sp. SYP-B805]
MGTVLVVGGDRLGNIVELLNVRGFRQIHHVTGRKRLQTKVKIPGNTEMIVVFTDFVNHNLSTQIKNQAKERNVPILFCKRSCSSLAKAFQ